jgi:hypothetical protein
MTEKEKPAGTDFHVHFINLLDTRYVWDCRRPEDLGGRFLAEPVLVFAPHRVV